MKSVGLFVLLFGLTFLAVFVATEDEEADIDEEEDEDIEDIDEDEDEEAPELERFARAANKKPCRCKCVKGKTCKGKKWYKAGTCDQCKKKKTICCKL